MNLEKIWQKYQVEKLNYAAIAPFLEEKGVNINYTKGAKIIEKGDFPSYVYFIVKGIVQGQKSYENGNEYLYFETDNTSGNLGLLEVLGRKRRYSATVTCLTDVEVIKVESGLVYQTIMNNTKLLQKVVLLFGEDLYCSSKQDGIYYYYNGINRLRMYLKSYFEKNSLDLEQRVIVSKTYGMIASHVGVSTKTISRNMQKLKENQEVTVLGKKIVLTKKHYLRLKYQLDGI